MSRLRPSRSTPDRRFRPNAAGQFAIDDRGSHRSRRTLSTCLIFLPVLHARADRGERDPAAAVWPLSLRILFFRHDAGACPRTGHGAMRKSPARRAQPGRRDRQQ